MLQMSSLITIINIFHNSNQFDKENTVTRTGAIVDAPSEKINSRVLGKPIDSHSQAAVKSNKDLAV